MKHKHKAEHDRLRAMIDDYLDLLRGDTPPDINEIMKRRLAFSNAFLSHVASEGPAFAALRTGDPNHPADRLLDEHACRMREIMPGYSALIQNWTPARILAEWPVYCGEVQAQVKRYYAFTAWQEMAVLPLLDQPVSASCRATSIG